jgi:hypothetical protein
MFIPQGLREKTWCPLKTTKRQALHKYADRIELLFKEEKVPNPMKMTQPFSKGKFPIQTYACSPKE